VYGLEREFALQRLVKATAASFLILCLLFAEFFIATFIAPSLPASDILSTPTLNLLVTPVGTAAPGTTPIPVTEAVPSGMTGCIPDQIMITAPEPQDVVRGVVTITGTANVPNFGFYKYEIAQVGTQNWATVSAARDPRVNETLGSWSTTSLTNGDYFLRLVITDNLGKELEPCVLAVRVLNE
jgi:hypothetical protein